MEPELLSLAILAGGTGFTTAKFIKNYNYARLFRRFARFLRAIEPAQGRRANLTNLVKFGLRSPRLAYRNLLQIDASVVYHPPGLPAAHPLAPAAAAARAAALSSPRGMGDVITVVPLAVRSIPAPGVPTALTLPPVWEWLGFRPRGGAALVAAAAVMSPEGLSLSLPSAATVTQSLAVPVAAVAVAGATAIALSPSPPATSGPGGGGGRHLAPIPRAPFWERVRPVHRPEPARVMSPEVAGAVVLLGQLSLVAAVVLAKIELGRRAGHKRDTLRVVPGSPAFVENAARLTSVFTQVRATGQ